MNAIPASDEHGYHGQQEAPRLNRLMQFDMFENLPDKIRYKIWQLASAPRIINSVMHNERGFPANPLLSTCPDSRAALIESYPTIFAIQSSWLSKIPMESHIFTRFNFKKDFAEMGGDIPLCFGFWHPTWNIAQHQLWLRANCCIMSVVFNKSTRKNLQNVVVNFYEFRVVFVEHKHLFAFKALRRIVLVLETCDRSNGALKPMEWKFVEPKEGSVRKEVIEAQRQHHIAFIEEIKRQHPDWSAPVLEIKDKVAMFAEDLDIELAKDQSI